MKRIFSRRRLADGLTMLVVTALSFLLLAVISRGEAERASIRFQAGKLTALGQVVQKTVETYLRSDQPLDQFAGFRPLAQPFLVSDPDISAFSVRDAGGKVLFEVTQEGLDPPPPPAGNDTVQFGGDYLQVVVPLFNRFEAVGALVISAPRRVVTGPVDAVFTPLVPWGVGLCLGLGLLAATGGSLAHDRKRHWQRGVFAVSFLLAGAMITAGMVGFYSDGARVKAQALANSLDMRINAVYALGLSLADVSELDVVLAEYRALNADIDSVALIEDGQILLHTNPALRGQAWAHQPRTMDFAVPLGQSSAGDPTQSVLVTIPSDIVYWAVARNVKNLSALFIATGLIALILFTLSRALAEPVGHDEVSPAKRLIQLDRIGPALFIGVFADNLSAAFLPQTVTLSATAAKMPSVAVSAVFLLYFLAFSLTVLPAEAFASRKGPRPLIWGGGTIAAVGAGLLALSTDFSVIVVARLLSGIGQAMLLIGVQSYIFATVTAEQRNTGNARIVFNYNAGMISGMAIGSLLVIYVEPNGVFALAGSLLALLTLYAGILPMLREGAPARPMPKGGALRQVLGDRGFLESIVLIGIPSKALLSGVIIFAMPLLLTRLHFGHEDIGQIVMFYAIGVILANYMINRSLSPDRSIDRILSHGLILSACALGTIGLVGMTTSPADGGELALLPAALVLAGVAMLGVAHGFINAPVVTHVTMLPIADRVGAGPVAAAYRVIERVGHVIGPVLIGQLLLLGDYDPRMLLLPAFLFLLSAIVFNLGAQPRRDAAK